MLQSVDVEYDNSSTGQVVWECIYFFLLSTPLALALINLQEKFDIQLEHFLFVLEYPLVRVVLAATGGLILWSYLRPWHSSSTRPWESLCEYSLDEAGSVTVRPLTKERLKDIVEGPDVVFLHTGDSSLSKEDLQAINERFSPCIADSTEEVWQEDSENVVGQEPSLFDPHQSVRLSIELVPKSCWFSNLRSGLSTEQWGVLRKRVYKSAGYRCQICNGRGPEHPVEAHETWSYDDVSCVQRLECVRALCPSCHTVKHFGLATIRGKEQTARRHLMDVNMWDAETASSYIDYSFAQWRQRSRSSWSLDLSHLKAYGYSAEEILNLENTRIQH
jgi:hypothetical protein